LKAANCSGDSAGAPIRPTLAPICASPSPELLGAPVVLTSPIGRIRERAQRKSRHVEGLRVAQHQDVRVDLRARTDLKPGSGVSFPRLTTAKAVKFRAPTGTS
jgi:hypothetical protein